MIRLARGFFVFSATLVVSATPMLAQTQSLLPLPGTVEVSVSAPGTLLLVDGGDPRNVEPDMPTRVSLEPGEHTLVAVSKGYETLSIDVEVQPGGTESVEMVLFEVGPDLAFELEARFTEALLVLESSDVEPLDDTSDALAVAAAEARAEADALAEAAAEAAAAAENARQLVAESAEYAERVAESPEIKAIADDALAKAEAEADALAEAAAQAATAAESAREDADAKEEAALVARAVADIGDVFDRFISTAQERPLLDDERTLTDRALGWFLNREVRNAGTGIEPDGAAAINTTDPSRSDFTARLESYLDTFGFLPRSITENGPPGLDSVLMNSGVAGTFRLNYGRPDQTMLEIVCFSDCAPSRLASTASYGRISSGTERIWVSPELQRGRIAKYGYDTGGFVINVSAREDVLIEVEPLALDSVTVFVFSETPGVEILGDGFREDFQPAADLRDDLDAFQQTRLDETIRQAGFGPQVEVAAVTGLPETTRNLELQFVSAGYANEVVEIDLNERWDEVYNAAGNYFADDAITLERLVGTLAVRSSPSGADVFLDTEHVGVTPLSITHPTDEYNLRVRRGGWAADDIIVSIRDSETSRVDLELKPEVVFLGIHSPDLTLPSVSEATIDDWEQTIADALGSATHYLGRFRDPAEDESLRDFLAAVVNGDTSQTADHLSELSARFDSELFLFAAYLTERDYLTRNLTFYLFSAYATAPDVRQVSLQNTVGVEEFVTELDAVVVSDRALVGPYVGLSTLDTELRGRELVVLKVDQDSPAMKAGLEAGDSIVGVNGAAATSSTLENWVRDNPVGTEVRLEVDRGAGREPETVLLLSEEVPRFLLAPRSQSQSLVNPYLVQFESMLLSASAGEGDESEYNLLLVNEALAYVAVGEWFQAIETLSGFRDAAGNAPLLVPAVQYYRGYCFERRGDREQARTNYQRATEAQSTTLKSHLGFEFQQLASLRLQQLEYLR